MFACNLKSSFSRTYTINQSFFFFSFFFRMSRNCADSAERSMRFCWLLFGSVARWKKQNKKTMCRRCLFNAEESVHNAVLCPLPYIIADTGLRHSAIDSCQHDPRPTHTHTITRNTLCHTSAQWSKCFIDFLPLHTLIIKITDLHLLNGTELPTSDLIYCAHLLWIIAPRACDLVVQSSNGLSSRHYDGGLGMGLYCKG